MGRFIDTVYGAFISKAFLKAERFQVNDAQLNDPHWKRGGYLFDEVGQMTDFRVMNIPENLRDLFKEFNADPQDFYLIYMYVHCATKIENINAPDSDWLKHLKNKTRRAFKRLLDRRIRRECIGKNIYYINVD